MPIGLLNQAGGCCFPVKVLSKRFHLLFRSFSNA